MSKLVRKLEALGRLLDTIAAIFAVAAIVLVCIEATVRYVAPRHAVDWGGELIIYLLIWGVFLLSGRLPLEDRHVAATVVIDRLPRLARQAAYFFALAIGLGFGLVLTVSGYAVVEFAARLDLTSVSSLRFPMAVYYFILPAAGALMSLAYAAKIALFVASPDRRLPRHRGVEEEALQ